MMIIGRPLPSDANYNYKQTEMQSDESLQIKSLQIKSPRSRNDCLQSYSSREEDLRFFGSADDSDSESTDLLKCSSSGEFGSFGSEPRHDDNRGTSSPIPLLASLAPSVNSSPTSSTCLHCSSSNNNNNAVRIVQELREQLALQQAQLMELQNTVVSLAEQRSCQLTSLHAFQKTPFSRGLSSTSRGFTVSCCRPNGPYFTDTGSQVSVHTPKPKPFIPQAILKGTTTYGAPNKVPLPEAVLEASTVPLPASAETTPASAETTPASAETTPATAQTTPASAETTPTSAQTTPFAAVAQTTPLEAVAVRTPIALTAHSIPKSPFRKCPILSALNSPQRKSPVSQMLQRGPAALPSGVWYDRVEKRYVVQCNENTACGRKKRKYFSISRYGEKCARNLAVIARLQVLGYIPLDTGEAMACVTAAVMQQQLADQNAQSSAIETEARHQLMKVEPGVDERTEIENALAARTEIENALAANHEEAQSLTGQAANKQTPTSLQEPANKNGITTPMEAANIRSPRSSDDDKQTPTSSKEEGNEQSPTRVTANENETIEESKKRPAFKLYQSEDDFVKKPKLNTLRALLNEELTQREPEEIDKTKPENTESAMDTIYLLLELLRLHNNQEQDLEKCNNGKGDKSLKI